MIELLKELGLILKDIPDLAIWVLAGILFYKVVIIGSIFGIIKLAINKLHDYKTKPIETIVTHKLADRFICHDGTYDRFIEFLDKVVSDNGGKYSPKGRYLHGSDVDFIEEAYMELKRSK